MLFRSTQPACHKPDQPIMHDTRRRHQHSGTLSFRQGEPKILERHLHNDSDQSNSALPPKRGSSQHSSHAAPRDRPLRMPPPPHLRRCLRPSAAWVHLPRSPGPTRRASPLRAFDLSASGIGPAVRRGRAAPPDRYWGTLRTAKLTGYEGSEDQYSCCTASPGRRASHSANGQQMVLIFRRGFRSIALSTNWCRLTR